jgi:D-alanyl-D-alanine carboxypeptidase/D-alanyl-D-alanine-endopeptidase (penicillin-binding protein 4)
MQGITVKGPDAKVCFPAHDMISRFKSKGNGFASRGLALVLTLGALFSIFCSPRQGIPVERHEDFGCLQGLSPKEAVVMADPSGRILYEINEAQKCVPASTLKVLTALTAIHHLGLSYRFKTEFYLDPQKNLKVKGYGDPFLVSETLRDIADRLADTLPMVKDLVLDDTYFSNPVFIPGRNDSTNPYDAPVGALCANFNTVYFHRDKEGHIVSSEPQTPMLPFMRERIRRLGLKAGRYTLSHDPEVNTLYVGNLLRFFLEERGVRVRGTVHLGRVEPGDRLFWIYLSKLTLEEILKEMLEFSSNFIANQVFITVGARVHNSPGTLEKGALVVSDYAKEGLHLKNVKVVEGSGLSRENRISPLDMLAILKRFRPYRHLLKCEGVVSFKTGTLRGIRARTGYIEAKPGGLYPFAVFLNGSPTKMDDLMDCLKRHLPGS